MRAARDVRSAVLMVILFVLGSAVGSDGAGPTTPGPEEISWRLTEVNGAVVPTLSGGKPPTLKLDSAQKKVSGYLGCNNFIGSYELDGASLRFGPIGATRRACEAPGNDVETNVLQALERTHGWRIEKGVLDLLNGEAVLARFTAASGGADGADPASMTYRLRSLSSGSVTLVNGAYHAPAAPGSASELMVTLTDKQAFGSIQGRDAGAVVLIASLGGTGSFYELALIAREAAGWENSDTILLGDRVKVHDLSIERDQVTVSLTTHGPQDPSCCPTVDVTKTSLVQNGRLAPAAEDVPSMVPQITGKTWQWVRTRYNNDRTATPGKPENYRVRFLDTGGIEIKADCNRKSGTYTLEGKKLAITVVKSTMAMCQPDSLEEQFARDLAAGAALFLQDGDLYIDLKYDSGTMRFTEKKED